MEIALYDRPTGTGRLSVTPGVNRDGGLSLECGIWLPVVRTQRKIAHGWHVVPIYRVRADRELTYTITPPTGGSTSTRRRKPIPVNPVTLALAFRRMLDEGEVENQSNLAKKVGLTRARVTQILNLLRLPSSVLQELISAGPDGQTVFSERCLRSITRLDDPGEQVEAFRDLKVQIEGQQLPHVSMATAVVPVDKQTVSVEMRRCPPGVHNDP